MDFGCFNTKPNALNVDLLKTNIKVLQLYKPLLCLFASLSLIPFMFALTTV